MKNTCNSPIYKAASFASALVIFMFCILPGFASADSVYSNDPVGWKDGDTFRNILAVVLDSWGISFSNTPGDVSLAEDMDALLADFYEDEGVLAEDFWVSAQFGANQLGQLILDHTTLGRCIQFANWLIDSYNLSNNSTVPVAGPSNQVYFGNNLAYEITSALDTFPVAVTNPSSTIFEGIVNARIENVNHTNLGYPVYVMNAHATFQNRDSILFYSTITFRYFVLTAVDGSWTVSSSPQTSAGGNYGHYSTSDSKSSVVLGLPIYNYNASSWNESSIQAMFNNGVITSRPSAGTSMVINTTIINIPDPDPDEGLQVDIPGTNWGDSIFTILDLIERLLSLYDSTHLNINSVLELLTTLLSGLQQSVTVENIPGAVVLDYDDYDIPLETDWSLVDGFFSNDLSTNPFSTISSIVYGFPEPLIIFFSVIVIFIVAYGFIRMGRDSH